MRATVVLLCFIAVIAGSQGQLRAPHAAAVYYVADLGAISRWCSGVLVSDNDVITTASCALEIEAMASYDHTAVETSSGDMYDARGVHKHGAYNAVDNKYDIAVIRLHQSVDRSTDAVKDVSWYTEQPPVGAECVYNYWGLDEVQHTGSATVVACGEGLNHMVCADGIPTAAICPTGISGGSLVCEGKLAGVFSPVNSCSDAPHKFHAVHLMNTWIYSVVSGAATPAVSLVAILVAVVAWRLQ